MAYLRGIRFGVLLSGWLLVTSGCTVGLSARSTADDRANNDAGVQSAATTVSVVSSTANVRPQVPASGVAAASLSAARNEFESFQIVIQAGATPQTGVTVSTDPAHPLTSAAGSIPNTNITIYRADYFNAAYAQSDREGGTGRWADPLIPSADYIYGEQRNAFPVDVPAGENRVAWIDVLVPATQAPGTYSGSLLVTGGGGLNRSVPVEVEVLDFTMPSTSTLKNSFLTNYRRVCDAHTGSPYCNWNDEQRWALHSLYARVGLENRITISNPWPLGLNEAPPAENPGRAYWLQYALPLIKGNPVIDSGGLWSAPRLQGAELTDVSFYAYDTGHCRTACVNAWKAEANASGFADKVIAYTCDEPVGDPAKWAACAPTANEAIAAWPQVDTLVTATINEAQGAGDPSKISILTPPVNRLDDVNNPPYVGNQRPNYDQYLADADNSLWSYVSCLSNGCAADMDPQSNGSYWDGWPSLAIDAPASQHRAMGWMAFLYDFSGELYWETTYRLDKAWNECLPLDPAHPNDSNCLFYEGTNGDGTLFYPGKGDSNADCPDASDRSCIGGTHDIPLETIRLKRIRDSHEDFELLNHLRAHGRASQARAVAESLFPNMHSVTPDRDGPAFDAARAALVDLLPADTVQPNIAFMSNRDGNNEIYVMDADGSNQVRLTNNPAADGKPAWSPDGSKIAFVSNRDGNDDVFVMDADGSNQVRLSNNPAADGKPAWSPDGSKIAFVSNRNGNDDVFVMTAAGSAATPLTTSPAGDYDPAWSPDGSKLVFTSGRGGTPDLYTMSAAGTSQQPLTGGIGGEDDLADWSNGGTSIAFDRIYGTSGNDYEIWRIGANGTNPVAVTTDPAHDYAPSFSSDDTRITFVSTRDGDPEVMVMNADGSNQTALTTNGSTEADPDWRPVAPTPSGGVRADFDGDGDSDVAVFRAGGSGWFVQGGLSTSWGVSGDVPVTGDFNGDGNIDIAVFRPSGRTWYVQPSASFPGGLATQWGITGDIPVPADYNGDGITDIAVFRPSDRTWYVQPSASFPGGLATQWGITGDIPVPADYNGDGTDEVAVYRPSNQTWYSQGGLATQWGITGDIPVPADYNGDGTDEVAVYRPSNQTWYSQGGLATQWGITGDRAIPGDYNGDGTHDVAVFRPSNQTWYVKGGLSTQWGITGDIPVIIPAAHRSLY